MIAVLAAIFMALVIFFSHSNRPYDSYLSAVSLFGVSVFFYLVAIPLEISITGNRYLKVHGTFVPISESAALHIVLSAILGYVAFCAGYMWFRRRSITVQRAIYRIREDAKATSAPLVVLAGLGIAALVLVFHSELVAVRDYASNVALVASNSAYALLVRLTEQVYGAWVFFNVCVRDWTPWRAILSAGPLVLWGLYSNDKDPIVIAGCCLAAFYVRTGNRFRSAAGFGMVTIGTIVSLAFGTLLFSLYRGGGSLRVDRFIERNGGFITSLEPAGPMVSILQNQNIAGGAHNYGSSLLQSLYLWIPQSIWPSRPYDLAQQFARDYMHNWSPGRGSGYSLLSEGYLIGGDIGVVALFFLVGLFFAHVRNYLLSDSRDATLAGISVSALYVVIMYVVFISLRGPFSMVISNIMQSVGAYISLVVLSRLFDSLARAHVAKAS